MNRRVIISDHTGNVGASADADGLVMEHELGFNRRGQLTSRTRGGQGLSWAYDADGNRTSFTDTHGATTTYTHDPAGRLTTVTTPHLGDAVFTHDPSGRLTPATAGDLAQAWTYRNGTLAEHTRTVSPGSTDGTGGTDDRGSAAGTSTTPRTDATLISRDDDGRITALTRAGAITRYGYDGAGQMVSAVTTPTTPIKSSDAQALGCGMDFGPVII